MRLKTICEPYQELFIHQLELHLPMSIWALKVIASSDVTTLESPAAKTISGERIEVLACVKTEKTEKYIRWQHGSLVLCLNGIRVTELRQRSRVGNSVRILRITGESCQLLSRCLQAE
jgi:hypothetical protein